MTTLNPRRTTLIPKEGPSGLGFKADDPDPSDPFLDSSPLCPGIHMKKPVSVSMDGFKTVTPKA